MDSISETPRGGALEGVAVIEIASTLAGEVAGGVLTDMGATVVKIEPPAGSPIRSLGPALPGEDSLYFQSENRGKYSVVVDLSSLATEAWFTELVKTADCVVEDLGPGGLEQHGLGTDVLQSVNPRLSILRLSPFGQTGPLAAERGDDRTAQAFGGGQFVTGFFDRPPQPITVPLADYWTGVHGASGLLAALLNARRSGTGDVVDLANYETLMRTLGSAIVDFDQDGRVMTRQGNFAQGVVPGNVFETKDGRFIAVSGAGEKPFARLCEAIEAPEAANDPRFATPAERRKYPEEANALVADWIGRHTMAEVEPRFAEMGVAGAAVRSADEIVEDPHVEAREVLVPLTSSGGATFRVPGPVPRLDRTRVRSLRAAPRLGEHSADIGAVIEELQSRAPVHVERPGGTSLGGPLDGFRVVDLAQVLAGPFAAGLMADFGAEVIMVELPGASGPSAGIGPGRRLGFLSTNRNKSSVTIDVRTPAGREALLDLVRVSDVLVENFRPGTLERWGLGPEQLLEANPGIVMMRISGFGQTGPNSPRSSYNPVACAFGGVTYLGGWQDRAPLRDGVTAGDYVSALFGVLGVMGALVRRDIDGGGQVVDVAMYEAALRMTGDTIALKTALGVRQERADGAWAIYPISLPFETADGRHVEISAQSWDEIGAVLGNLEIPAEQEPDSLRAGLQDFVGTLDADTVVAELRLAGANCSQVNSVADLHQDAHVWSRENLARIEHPNLGSIVVPGVVPMFERRPGRVTGWSEFPGSDNQAVLGGLLAYSDERIEQVTEGAADVAGA
jgi:crotonobetainyl-CoA:carnitine CoA-transferase CaiB-like acyl-CoA transferase